MAGKKNYAVVSVISGLTRNQAAQTVADIQKAKAKNAPGAYGTTATMQHENVGRFLSSNTKRIK